jgi:HAMP domain-containing protein
VFELYEPVGDLDAILIRAAVPIMAVPGLVLLLFSFALSGLVNRAQADIDMRTRALNDLRRRIETFVSTTTVNAAKSADSVGGIESRMVTTTLLFTDVRSFTSFAEKIFPRWWSVFSIDSWRCRWTR